MSVLPGASRANVELVFWNTAREFYRRSRSWREKLGAFTLGAGQDTLSLQPVDQNADICYLEAVQLEGTYLYMRPGYNGGYAEGTPGRIWLEDPHTLRINPTPVQEYRGLWLYVSASPARNAEALPAYAETHHFQALEVGTLGKLMAQPNKPWTEPANAMLNQRRFEIAIARARADAEKEYGKTAGNWSFNQVSVR
jgi:hypothetical protein